MARSINAVPQYLDDAGDPLISGKVYFYDPGSSSPKTTYSDIALTIANTNPVILSASGRLPNVFFDGTAKVKLTDSADVQIWERDQVGAGQSGAFVEWDALTSFAFNDITQGSDDYFYISLTSDNQANDPVSDAVNWSQITLIGVYNTNEIYALNDLVRSGGYLFRSLAGANQGNATTDATKWGIAVDLTDVTLTNVTVVGDLDDISFTGSLTEETYTIPDLVLNTANGTIQTKTMAANTDFSSTTTIAAGQYITLHLIGGDIYTVTYPTITWIAGVAPVLTAKDVIEFWKVGTTLFGAHVGGYV